MPHRVSWIWIFVLGGLAGALGVLVVGHRVARQGPRAEPHTTLLLTLSGSLPEDLAPASRGQFLLTEERTLWEIVRGIDAAASDPNVEALLVKVEPLDVGWAKLDELRDAFRRFAAAQKPVGVWLEDGGDAEYYLATAATAIFAPPGALLSVNGLTATSIHLKEGLDELGVRFDLERVGEYKDAPELFTEPRATVPSREVMNSILDESHSLLVEAMCEARGWSVEEARTVLDRGPYRSEEALDAGLVDQLLRENELEDGIAEGFGANTMDFEDYLDAERPPRGSRRIAVVFATGTIQTGESESDPFSGERSLGSETLAEALQEAGKDERVKAIVLRVDSPGGDTYASRLLYEEVKKTAALKPVVASFSDLAASGGYYLAMGADTIVAQPGTLTGSIGIFGGKIVYEKLMDRLGVNAEVYARGQNAQMDSPFRPYTPSERDKLLAMLLAEYRDFVQFVAENRGRGEDEIDALARGRVWSGSQAFVRGLVDTLGGYDVAARLAREAAEIGADEEVEFVVYPRVTRTLIQRFLAELFESSRFSAPAFPRPIARALARWSRIPRGPTFAWLPYRIEIR